MGHRVTAVDGAPEEREVKLAVAGDFAIPDLALLGDVTVVDRGDRRLHAVYWDSTSLALAAAGVGVRHRNGVWTYKGRSHREGDAVVREEVEIGGDAGTLPERIRELVQQWTDPDDLHPVAELDTVRHLVEVHAGVHSVELVHDHVHVVDGARVVARFAEVEVEFIATSRDLADRVVGLLVANGATVHSTAKLVRALRALGHEPPPAAI